ncbi:T9SS type A sorting domain-containing protein [Flavobacterium sp. U410]|jgi:alpha-tubulin suppressor-like RCC1 family protein
MKKLYLLILVLVSIMSFGQTYDYTIYDTSNSGIASNYVGDVKIDSNGLLWISSYSGVSTFDGTTWTIYNTSNSGIASNAISEVEIDGLGRKWMASGNNGVILLNGTTWTNYTSTNSGLPSNGVSLIAVDGLNNLWAVTDFGLTKFDGTTWTTYNALTNINSIEIDETNGIWVTNNGVMYKFNGSDYDFIYQGTDKILKTSGDMIYVAGFDNLFTFTIAGDFLASYYQGSSCLAGYQLKALDVDSNDKVWIAFSGDGLQNFTDCVSYTTSNSDLPDNYFSTVNTQATGTIWVGTLQLGLVKMSNTATCNPPTQFWTENITATSATLNWLAPSTSSPDGYIYVYNTTNEIGGIDGYTTSTSASIDGLSPNTDYHWWVASVCGNEQSEWVYGGYFLTLQAETSFCWQTISSGQQFTVAIKEDGTLWSWGANNYGQLGHPSASNINIPTQIGVDNNWENVSCGSGHVLALKSDGSLWAWGYNQDGQLGDGTTINRNTPVQIGSATNWQNINAGGLHSLALKTNGTLWSWGLNTNGQLGDGTTTNKNIPIQIGTAADWVNIGTGNTHSLAIKSNGTLWAWGSNNSGQLGDQSTIAKTTPVQVGTSNDWKNIDGGINFTVATKTNGTLWTWGSNDYGQLGLNDLLNRAYPSQVGSATSWDLVSAGGYQVIATRNYGAIFSWGRNDSGQLGNGTYTDVLAPGLLFNEDGWTVVSTGYNFSSAIVNNGNLHTWGYNSSGQLGNGSYTNDTYIFGTLPCPTSTLSTEDFAINKLKVYPNPVNDVLNISFDNEITAVSIINLLGQEVLTKAINATEGKIDVSDLTPGTYLVKVTSNNEGKILKIIKD